MSSRRPPAPGKSLADQHPNLAAEWDRQANELGPEDVTSGSGYRAHWRCGVDPSHTWQATVNARVGAGTGCPQCRNKKVSTTNNLLAMFPDIATEWHPTRNDRSPAEVTFGSGYRAWWRCSSDPSHEWPVAVDARTADNSQCPFCSGRRPAPTSNLSVLFPDLASQWDVDANGDLTPDQVRPGASIRAWWRCPAGDDHRWSAKVSNRTSNKTGCPFCAGRRPSTTNSLASLHPDLAAQWHPDRNGERTPETTVAGSSTRVWWKCPNGPDHEWDTPVQSRSVAGNGCPFCANRRASVTNSLGSLHPDLAAQWHPERNGKRTPEKTAAASSTRVWWKCPNGPDHEWQTSVSRRTLDGTSCPFCTGGRISVTNNLSVVRPDLAAQWHPTRNGKLTPADVMPGSAKRIWWQCSADSSHEWPAGLNSRSNSGGGSGCPKCASYGFNPSKPGVVYVMSGQRWGKVGISNVLATRMQILGRSETYGDLVTAVEFASGADALELEVSLLAFVRGLGSEQAPSTTDGYTESFPSASTRVVLDELARLRREMVDPGTDISLEHSNPK